jgi:hypothetical protein
MEVRHMLYKKICNSAILVTSILVFITWKGLIKTELPISDLPFLKYVNQDVLKFVIGYFMAYGFFNFIVFFTINILIKITIEKKIILGSFYFEGTWIGYYFGPEKVYDSSDNVSYAARKVPVIFFQTIQQNIDEIIISNTEAYHKGDDNLYKTHRCSWHSISNVSISSSGSLLSYLYHATSIQADDDLTLGLFTGTFHRKGIFNNPCRIQGQAFNTYSKKYIKTLQIKEKNSIKITSEEEVKKLLEKAIEFYLKHNTSNLEVVQNTDNL